MPGDEAQLIVVVFDPTQKGAITRSGDLAVFMCSSGRYTLLYRTLDDPGFQGEVSNPRILAVEDATGDGIAELAFVTGDCGMDTCLEGVTILSSAGASAGALTNLAPDFAYLPNPVFDFVPSNRGLMQDLIAIEGHFGSVDAGPQRIVTDTWSFNGNTFTLTQAIKEPAVYRVHALHDADDALRRKDFATADALFGRVINDASLQMWEGTGSPDEPQLLAAFAYIRLMQSAAARGDSAGVQTHYQTLKNTAPAGTPAQIYAQLGDAFFNAWSQSPNLARACDAAIAFANQNPNAYRFLGSETYGFANADYRAEDMCIR